MNETRRVGGIVELMLVLACVAGISGCQLGVVRASEEQAGAQSAASPQSGQELVIENESPLPETYPRGRYEVHMLARGGVPGLQWRVVKGTLPAGIVLEESGLLHGEAERTGEFQFTASVTDSGKPQLAVEKMFVIRVRSALSINWKSAAHVTGNRIEGSVEVSNTTPDDMDLTFIVMAVAANGRATAIGYQRFDLQRGTIAKELPFGETLPRGGYVVHVDAVGEVPPRNLIYRERMQTPGPLQVAVGP